MTNNLTNKTDAELRKLLQTSRQMLTSLVDSLAGRPDMQEAARILMRPDDMLETFSELAAQYTIKRIDAGHSCQTVAHHIPASDASPPA